MASTLRKHPQLRMREGGGSYQYRKTLASPCPGGRGGEKVPLLQVAAVPGGVSLPEFFQHSPLYGCFLLPRSF